MYPAFPGSISAALPLLEPQLLTGSTGEPPPPRRGCTPQGAQRRVNQVGALERPFSCMYHFHRVAGSCCGRSLIAWPATCRPLAQPGRPTRCRGAHLLPVGNGLWRLLPRLVVTVSCLVRNAFTLRCLVPAQNTCCGTQEPPLPPPPPPPDIAGLPAREAASKSAALQSVSQPRPGDTRSSLSPGPHRPLPSQPAAICTRSPRSAFSPGGVRHQRP